MSLGSCAEGNFATGDVRKKLFYSTFKTSVNLLGREPAKGNEKLTLKRAFSNSDKSVSVRREENPTRRH